MTKKELTKRQACWAEKLAGFGFTVEYRADKTNPADGPSRRPDYDSNIDHAQQLLTSLHRKLGSVFMLRRRRGGDGTVRAAQDPDTEDIRVFQVGMWNHGKHVAAY